MIQGYKPQFVPKILDGTKIHTIRLDIHNRWKKGMKIHQATGVRTKRYCCFAEKVCTGVQYILFALHHSELIINIGDSPDDIEKIMTIEVIDLLAKNDGFETVEDFENWFVPIVDKATDNCLVMKIIHWTDYRY